MLKGGPVRTLDGSVVGAHRGLLGVTVGQRHGIGLAAGERMYVVRIEPETSSLWIGPREAVRCAGLIAWGGNLLAPRALLEGTGVSAKVRYRHPAVPCNVNIQDDGSWEVRFLEAEGAVAPGQSIVFYAGDRMIGGARIDAATPDSRT